MPLYPRLINEVSSLLNTQVFYGLNRGLSISDGEMADMLNMSSDHYPVLSTRKKRGKPVFPVEGGGATEFDGAVGGMLGTDRLIVCHGGKVYMDGEEMPLTLSAEEHMQPKHMVAMGAYVCIWPDKKYFNVTNPSDCGPIGAKWEPVEGASISAMMCRKDGTNYDMEDITVSDTAPAEPEDKQFWLDTSGEVDVLKQYSSIYQQWTQVATTYIKIQADGIGKELKDGDVVFLSGVAAQAEAYALQMLADGAETLTFPGPDVTLRSDFIVTSNGSVETANLTKKTVTIDVQGIPEGATVTSAVLKFRATSSAYGAKSATVNGVAFQEATTNEVPVEVTGNGEVSLLFAYRSNSVNAGTGTHYGLLSILDMTLEVSYAVTGTSPDTSDADKEQLEALNTSNIIYGRGNDYIIVAGLLHGVQTLANTLRLEMKIPDLDYVCEANNRLWGCSYATVDGTLTNELRACALGDFRNWYRFEGTSMDSYTASVGSDGPFTGAYSIQGVPIFFKEDYLHKVSGTQPSNFTLNTIRCRGVQDGSWRSMAVVNETLFYKARNDVMAYDGAAPYSVGEKLGPARMRNAVGGAYRDKYYVCMQDENIVWHVYVLDTAKGLWHKEDESHVLHMAGVDGTLVMAVQEGDKTILRAVGGSDASEGEYPWSVTFGVFGYQYEQQKYLSRFNIRLQMSAGSEMKVEIMYDSNGEWVEAGNTSSPNLRTLLLPIIPRRCDHCQVRLSGTGTIRIYSIARVLRQGGDG